MSSVLHPHPPDNNPGTPTRPDNGYQREDKSVLRLPEYKLSTISQVLKYQLPSYQEHPVLQESRESYASMSESPRCRSSLLLVAKHGEGGHSVPNIMTNTSCDYPYRPLLTPCTQGLPNFTESVRSLNTSPIPIITTSHESPPDPGQALPGLQRIIRQRSNPENKTHKCCLSTSPSLSPRARRRSFIPGVGTERLASVVSDSIKLNGTIGQLKQVCFRP